MAVVYSFVGYQAAKCCQCVVILMNNNKNNILKAAFLPFLFVIACLLANNWAGSLDITNVIDERSQRDFNAALGMPVMIGYLWLTLRVLHRRAAQRIGDFLVCANRLSEYETHLKALEKKLVRQVIIASALSISITMVYLVAENLLALDQKISVLLLNAMAIPFWFFLFLFLMQSASFTRYLYRRLVVPNVTINNNFCDCKQLCDLGISNVVFCLMMFLFLPIFWLGKPVPLIDVLILLAMILFLILLLFFPVIKTVLLIRQHRNRCIEEVEDSIEQAMLDDNKVENTSSLPAQLNRLNQRLEDLKQYKCWPQSLAEDVTVFAISASFPVLYFAATSLL